MTGSVVVEMLKIDQFIESIRKCILPSTEEIEQLCSKVSEILIEEDNLVRLNAPISICGDIHGQFYDLLELFAVGDDCPETSYCFMGDYVDRGYHSVETISLLFALKVRYPSRITLLRGNHESRSLTKVYGFYDECLQKFSSYLPYKYFMETFDLLPLCAVVGDSLFLVHGGISPELDRIDNLNLIERRMEIPNDSIVSDLMWSDPNDDDDALEDWELSSRGAGYVFGPGAVKRFNETNGIDCILRSHQIAYSGYRYMFKNTLCIVWSAPNYHYTSGNVASILEVDEDMSRRFIIFKESESSLPDATEVRLLHYFL